MNKLSEDQINDLLSQYDISIEMIEIIEDTFRDLIIEDYEYYLLISEVVSEYQSFIINKELNSDLATPYKNLKDIIIKVLNYKLKGVTEENSKYENEVNSLILRLTNN
jgi:predicted GTPase